MTYKNIVKLIATVLLSLGTLSYAIHPGEGDLPYSRSMEHELDKPVNDATGGKSFLMNLGPTGIRARMDPDAPKALKVVFVFQDVKSPAKKLINPGDWIVGANGKEFRDPHGFHRKQNGRGWVGPPYELALAIEDAQGRDGKLSLKVMEGGKGSAKNVDIQLKPVGRFSNTWPWNCPRSDQLRKDLADFLVSQPLKGMIHLRAQYTFAIYASGHKDGEKMLKELAQSIIRSNPDPEAGGMCTWGWGYQGIVVGEYYKLTKDKSVVPWVEKMLDCYQTGQTYGNGGYSHRPYPAITRRIASGGPKGYGAMAGPGGLQMLAQSIFRANGLPYNEIPYNETHYAYLRSCGANESGTLAYGFKGSTTYHIRLKNPSSPCKSPRGIGFECPTGLENIGIFEVEDWKEKSGTWEMNLVSSSRFPDISKSTPGLRIFDEGENRRCVVIPDIPSEPKGPYSNNHQGGGHNAPVGMGALSHFIGNQGNTSWNHLGKHMATGCAYSPKTLWDGHASGEMHAFWAALGASRADEKDFRQFLDYTKTWIILSESHDGQGLVDQPFGCQRNSTCSINLNRTAYTHVALMLLSIPNRNLLITGADYQQPAPKTVSSGSSSYASRSTGGTSTGARAPVASGGKHWTEIAKSQHSAEPKPVEPVKLREARTLSESNQKVLDRSLLAALKGLSDAQKFDNTTIPISLSPRRVRVLMVESNMDIVFFDPTTMKSANVKMEQLKNIDKASLSILIAQLQPESENAKAMAGVYLEAAGQVAAADKYFDKAGESATRKLSQFLR